MWHAAQNMHVLTSLMASPHPHDAPMGVAWMWEGIWSKYSVRLVNIAGSLMVELCRDVPLLLMRLIC